MKDIVKSLQAEYISKRNNAIVRADEKIVYRCRTDEKFNSLYTQWRQCEIDLLRSQHYNTKPTERRKLLDMVRGELEKYLKKTKETLTDYEPKFECAICNDSGVVGGKYCECFTNKYKSMLSNLTDVDSGHTFEVSRHDELDTHNISTIYDKVKLWCDRYPDSKVRNINLLGYTGTGKTYLLECIANAMVQKGLSVQYTTAFNLNNQCKLYHFSKPNELDKFISADVLLIDDLGSEPVINNVTIEYLYVILNERLLHKRATCISSNLDVMKILDRYGERIYSRMFNKQLALNILFEGKDNRTQV